MMGNQRNDTMLYGINYKHLIYKLQSKRKAKKRISFNTQLNKTVVAARPRRDPRGGRGRIFSKNFIQVKEQKAMQEELYKTNTFKVVLKKNPLFFIFRPIE